MPLLPAKHFSTGYNHVLETARDCGLFDDLEKLFKYYESYWFSQVCDDFRSFVKYFLYLENEMNLNPCYNYYCRTHSILSQFMV